MVLPRSARLQPYSPVACSLLHLICRPCQTPRPRAPLPSSPGPHPSLTCVKCRQPFEAELLRIPGGPTLERDLHAVQRRHAGDLLKLALECSQALQQQQQQQQQDATTPPKSALQTWRAMASKGMSYVVLLLNVQWLLCTNLGAWLDSQAIARSVVLHLHTCAAGACEQSGAGQRSTNICMAVCARDLAGASGVAQKLTDTTGTAGLRWWGVSVSFQSGYGAWQNLQQCSSLQHHMHNHNAHIHSMTPWRLEGEAVYCTGWNAQKGPKICFPPAARTLQLPAREAAHVDDAVGWAFACAQSSSAL